MDWILDDETDDDPEPALAIRQFMLRCILLDQQGQRTFGPGGSGFTDSEKTRLAGILNLTTEQLEEQALDRAPWLDVLSALRAGGNRDEVDVAMSGVRPGKIAEARLSLSAEADLCLTIKLERCVWRDGELLT